MSDVMGDDFPVGMYSLLEDILAMTMSACGPGKYVIAMSGNWKEVKNWVKARTPSMPK